MSAYAAGRPLGKGLRALSQAVEAVRTPLLEGHRPALGGLGRLVRRHAPPGEAWPSTAHPRPSPRPRPGPRPGPAAQPPRPGPRPYPTGGPGARDQLGARPRPYPRPAEQAAPAPGGPNGAAPAPTPTPAPAPPSTSTEPDASVWELVEQAQAGHADAFGQLYDRYVDLVHRYIYYRVGDRSTAEDFTSETFLRAWRRIGSVTNQGRDIGAWFITIARNIVLDHVKSSRYRLEISTADMLDADQQEDGPEEAVLDRLSNAELLRCVKQLNAEQQECIVLRFLEGLSVAETAAVMDKNEGAIKALQHRAVRRLAGLLPEGFR